APLLITTKEPGPVGGASGPVLGSRKLSDVALSPAPGLIGNGPTLPSPGQAQNTLTATPLVASKPAPSSFTMLPCFTTVWTLLVANCGWLLVAAKGTPLMPVRLGIPAAAEPCNSAEAALEALEP